MAIRVDPQLVAALARPGPCRVSVRSATRQPVLEGALRAAAAAIQSEAGTPAVTWRHVEPWVGELVVDVGCDPGTAATVVQAIVAELGRAGLRDGDVLAVGGAAQPVATPEPLPEGRGPSRALNGLAEAVGSAYDRAGEPILARRAREAAAGVRGGDESLEDQRRRAVLGLVLRCWLPDELDAAGATPEAAVLRSLPEPVADPSAALDAVGRAVLAAGDRLEATPRAAILDLESAYAVGRDLHDVTWGCAGQQGRAGEALAEAAANRRPADPGQVLWTAATTGALQRLLPLIEVLGPDALERWRRLSREERTLHALVVRVLGAPTGAERLGAVDDALHGAIASAPPAPVAALEAALGRLPSVAWSLAVCTGWEAAGERCRHVVARRGAEGRTALTARDAATEAVLAHVRGLTDTGAELLDQLARP